jgi:hypothetical protein
MEALFCEKRASAAEERISPLPRFRHDPPLGCVEDLHHHLDVTRRRATVIVESSRFDVEHRDPADNQLVGAHRMRKGTEAAESQRILVPPSDRGLCPLHHPPGRDRQPVRAGPGQQIGQVVGGEPLREDTFERRERTGGVEIDYRHGPDG